MPTKKKRMTGLTSRNTTREQTLFGEQINPTDLGGQGSKSLHDTDRYRAKYISLDEIIDNTANRFIVADTSFLEASIRKLGQLQPIVVLQTKNEEGRVVFEIKAGSRRFKALNNIHKNAIAKGDKEEENRFSQAFCIVLPDGASQQEIDAVITETNTTARNITIAEIFMNFDLVFDRDEDGNYKYLPKNKNKYNSASELLKSMGYTFSPSSIKQYLSIYTAHNPKIRTEFEQKLINKKQALAISRMTPVKQDELMSMIDGMKDQEINDFIKNYKDEQKPKAGNDIIRGVETLNSLNKIKKKVSQLAQYSEIKFVDDLQKQSVLNELEELKQYLSDIENNIK